MDAKTKIAKAKTRLVFKHPFFGSCALGLNFVETDKKPTMATDGRTIWWNKDFIDKHTEMEITGVIAHEVLHVVFKHCLRAKSDLNRWNVACDIAINNILNKNGFKLPEGGLCDHDSHKTGGHKGWNAERIYNDIPADHKEPEWGALLVTMSENGQEMSKSELSQVEADINIKIIMAHDLAKKIGKTPGNEIEELIKDIKKPQIDWRDVFHRVIGGDQPDDYTWKRCNRKVYYTQGIYMPSVQNYGAGDIIVAIDTSGSVSNEEMKYFLTELNSITEAYKPNSVTVIQCDSEIQKVDYYRMGDIIDSIECHGRGGTDCNPVFDYINDNNLPCDNFVYLTDLEMWSFPEVPPSYPVLWVTTEEENAPFGQITKLRMENQ